VDLKAKLEIQNQLLQFMEQLQSEKNPTLVNFIHYKYHLRLIISLMF